MVEVISRAAAIAQESHDAWLGVYKVVAEPPLDAGRAACPNCGHFQISFRFVADPDSRIGFCSMWCENCFHGHTLSRVRVPAHLAFLPLTASAKTLRREIPDFIDVTTKELRRPGTAARSRSEGLPNPMHSALADRDRLPGLLAIMTPRERQVVTLFLDGHSNSQIAERLLVSPSTVQSLLERVYWKLGQRNVDRPA